MDQLIQHLKHFLEVPSDILTNILSDVNKAKDYQESLETKNTSYTSSIQKIWFVPYCFAIQLYLSDIMKEDENVAQTRLRHLMSRM